jgi:tetratricopeptide (TPR) repeat protein
MHLSIPGRLAVSTLLVLGLAVERSTAQPVDVRTVTMRVAADESYRSLPDWEANLRRIVRVVSDIYEKQFQIRFVVLDLVQFQTRPRGSVDRHLEKLVADVPIGEADVLIGFTGEGCVDRAGGAARAFGRFAVIMAACAQQVEGVLAHEIGHLFGAFHPAVSVDSVMGWRGGPPGLFDDQTTRVLRLMRSYDFRRGILAVDDATRRAWRAIYAEGHQRNNEVNPLVSALAHAGRELARSGKPTEGEAVLREAIAIDQLLPEPHVVLGIMYARRGLLEEAAQELRLAKSVSSTHVGARTELGFVLRGLGKDQEALSEFDIALRMNPRMVRARVGLCGALAGLRRFDEAIRECTEAIRLAPEEAVGYNGRGIVHRQKGDFDLAIRDFDEAIRLHPTVATGWNNRCFVQAVAGRLEAALADCEESLRLQPDFTAALDSRGLTYLKLGRLDRAIADYDAALSLDGRLGHALYGRGLARRKMGDHAGAEADFAAALKRLPRIAEDYAGYAIVP